MARKTPYIPHKAEFKFKPRDDWSVDEAAALYAAAAGADRLEYRDAIQGLREMPAACVDCVVTDPPFGLGFTGRERFYNRDGSNVVDGYTDVAPAEYPAFSRDWIAAAARALRPSGSCYIFSGYTNLRHVLNAVADAGLALVNILAWIYNFGVYAPRKYVTEHYHIVFAVKDPRRYYFNAVEHYVRDHWEIPRENRPGQPKNATKLPRDVVRALLDFSTRPGDVVLDPFFGDGTIPVVARANFRRCRGFEINAALAPLVGDALAAVAPGCDYTPYASRLPTAEELAARPGYRPGYRAFLAEQAAAQTSRPDGPPTGGDEE